MQKFRGSRKGRIANFLTTACAIRIFSYLITIPIVTGALAHGQVVVDTFVPDGPGELFGIAMASGDFNGDSVPDVAIGSPGAAGGAGRVYVEYGLPDGGTLRQRLEAPANILEFGFDLAASDLDGDGDTELVIGAPGELSFGGAVFVYTSQSNLQACDLSIPPPNCIGAPLGQLWTFSEPIPGERFGQSVATTPDMDLDGIDEVLVGAPGSFTSPLLTGEIFVFGGMNSGLISASVASSLGPFGVTHEMGFEVVGGDLDGRVELINGEQIRRGDAGVLYRSASTITTMASRRVQVLTGTQVGVTFAIGTGAATGNLSVASDQNSQPSLSQISLSPAGDLDGDGTAEILVAFPRSNQVSGFSLAGRVRVLSFGSASGIINVRGDNAGDLLGSAVTSLGDTNQDGFDDVLAVAIESGFVSSPTPGYLRAYSGGSSTAGPELLETTLSTTYLSSIPQMDEVRAIASVLPRAGENPSLALAIVSGGEPQVLLMREQLVTQGSVLTTSSSQAPLTLDAGSGAAGRTAIAFLSSEISSFADPFSDTPFPLDDGTSFSLDITAPLFSQSFANHGAFFVGNPVLLDGNGRATMTLDVPVGAILSSPGGMNLEHVHVSYILIEDLGTSLQSGLASNNVTFLLN